MRMDTAGGGADDLLGRAAPPLKVGHPADHWVILRGRRVICLSVPVFVSVSVCLCPSFPLHLSLSLGRRSRRCEEDRQYHRCFHLSFCDMHARTHARSCLLSPLPLARVLSIIPYPQPSALHQPSTLDPNPTLKRRSLHIWRGLGLWWLSSCTRPEVGPAQLGCIVAFLALTHTPLGRCRVAYGSCKLEPAGGGGDRLIA